ncbi:MAG: helix-turn-helix transcriptional regulator [Sphingomonas sp.]
MGPGSPPTWSQRAHPAIPVARERFLRLPEVKQRTGLSRSTIYDKMASGRFPKQKKLGARMSAWYETEIDSWIADPK